LTDFSTSFSFDLAPMIDFADDQIKREAKSCLEHSGFNCPTGGGPVKSDSGTGTIQLDVLGERFKMTTTGQGEYGQSSMVPAQLRGVKVAGSGSIAFDAKSGFIVYKAKVSTANSMYGPASAELCAKVNFPQGLLPPGSMIMAQLD
jgi:hypothetical protein